MTPFSKVAEWTHLPAFLTGSGILNDLLSSTVWLTQTVCRLSQPRAFNSAADSKKPPTPRLLLLHEPSHLSCHFIFPRPNTMSKNAIPPPSGLTSSYISTILSSNTSAEWQALRGRGRDVRQWLNLEPLNPINSLLFPHLCCTQSTCESNNEYKRMVENTRGYLEVCFIR